jgi:hypothetical protein
VWNKEHQEVFETLKRALCEVPVLQVHDFSHEFVLVTDASDIAVLAVLQQKVAGALAPIAYYSRVLTAAERKYSTYEKECLVVLFGCEKCRGYLEHKEFELHCDNLALCWLLKRVKDVGRLGRWILRLAPFKFQVRHTRGVDNVADALSRMFEGHCPENPETACASILGSLPLVYLSLEEHQRDDVLCRGLVKKMKGKEAAGNNFQIHNGLLCYFPKRARKRRWVVPSSLRPMLLRYSHDGVFAGHLGARKTLSKSASNFWWPGLCNEVFNYVCKCEPCQHAQTVQDTRIGLRSAEPSSRPMEKIVVDFVGPLVRSERGNIAILVVVDSFSKFISFYLVRKITARVVADCLECGFFPAYGTPTVWLLTTLGYSVVSCLKIYVFAGGSNILPLRRTTRKPP